MSELMHIEDYRLKVLERLTSEYKEKCLEMTGITPSVLFLVKKTGRPELSELFDVVNKFIPDHLIDKHPTIRHGLRRRKIAELRHIFCHLAYRVYGYSQPQIAVFLGIDTSSVWYCLQKFQDFLLYDEHFKHLFYNIQNSCPNSITHESDSIQHPEPVQSNPEPVLPAVALQEQHQVYATI